MWKPKCTTDAATSNLRHCGTCAANARLYRRKVRANSAQANATNLKFWGFKQSHVATLCSSNADASCGRQIMPGETAPTSSAQAVMHPPPPRPAGQTDGGVFRCRKFRLDNGLPCNTSAATSAM